jgi:hypothetical protein
MSESLIAVVSNYNGLTLSYIRAIEILLGIKNQYLAPRHVIAESSKIARIQ